MKKNKETETDIKTPINSSQYTQYIKHKHFSTQDRELEGENL